MPSIHFNIYVDDDGLVQFFLVPRSRVGMRMAPLQRCGAASVASLPLS